VVWKLTSCPLSLSNIGTPLLPVMGAFPILLEALLFLGKVLLVVNYDHGGG
jgi:hypothetical protein